MVMLPTDQLLERASRARIAAQLQESESLCRQILLLDPGHSKAFNLLGILAAEAGDASSAAALFRRAILNDSSVAEYHSNLGNVLRALGDTDAAIAAYQSALERRPDGAEIHRNLGCALLRKGEFEIAVASLRHALALKPRFAEVYSNLGNALIELGQAPDAIAAYRAAIAIGGVSPADLAELHCNLGMALLLTGEFEEGWRGYEWRLKSAIRHRAARDFPQPRWNGEPLAGKTILLHAEQGFGDTLQFIRYVRPVAERGATVIVACQKELLRLFSRLPRARQWLAEDQPLPAFDFHCPLLSLPWIFNTAVENIPPQDPPLSPPPEVSSAWRQKITDGEFKIGIAWAGSTGANKYARRPIPLRLLASLAEIPGVRLISLQKGPAAHEAAADARILDLTAGLGDFADTAALIEALDLVISVDSAVAHLAGAMNKPVWTMLAFAADWRWGQAGEQSAWYPSMRLFRQGIPGDWHSVADRIKAELISRVSLANTRSTS